MNPRSSAETPVSRLGYFDFHDPPDPEWFRARVAAAGRDHDGRPVYSLEEVVPTRDGTRFERLAGGVTTDYLKGEPAYELNDAVVPVGVVVFARIRRHTDPGGGSGSGPGTVRVFEFAAGGGGGADGTFLAVLVEKFGTSADLITYSWAEVTPVPPDAYALTGVSGCPGNSPAFHERNFDVPVVGPAGGGSGGGSGGGCPHPAFVHPLSVFRMRRVGGGGAGSGESGSGADSFCLFSGHPWEDLFRRTGVVGPDGEDVFHRYYPQPFTGWADGVACVMIEAE